MFAPIWNDDQRTKAMILAYQNNSSSFSSLLTAIMSWQSRFIVVTSLVLTSLLLISCSETRSDVDLGLKAIIDSKKPVVIDSNPPSKLPDSSAAKPKV